ncbi:relaxase/mobilization nuclease domain-containing protein (plasmid) [Moraxella lincolnii]|uniref:relaxase/mobilization nuclease domain-containing protein n=1 Tax=Lwoffella lincolnii TaxID=90241 RepID=UPI0030D08E69
MAKIYDDPDYWFAGTPKKTKKSASSGGMPSFSAVRPNYNAKKTALNAIKGVNKKLPQVVVKISGSSKGANKAQAHADYIGRNGKVEIEDQDGNKYKGKNEQKELLGAWLAMGMHDKHETGSRREAFHFVFSMPNGTNPIAMKTAVKNLVKEEFDGHKFFMAQHLDTDSPHVHVLLNATNDKGERLNPRKQDLHNYRVNFVEKLREQGIEATATRRIHQFKYKDNKRQGVIHKDERTGIKQNNKKPTASQLKTIQATHKDIAKQYQAYVDNLPSNQAELKTEIKKLVENRVVKNRGRER